MLNAIEALSTHSGKRMMKVSISKSNDGTELKVSDTGPGIAKINSLKSFSLFYNQSPGHRAGACDG